MIAVPINFTLFAFGFVSVCFGIIFSKRRKLLILFMMIGLMLFAAPFVRQAILTSDAYIWTIIVERTIDESADPKVIFIDEIEWVTDYQKLKGQRRSTRSYLLNEKNTRKVWSVKGYIPRSIQAKILYGRYEGSIYKLLDGLEAGSYTFILTFDEKDIGSWTVEPGNANIE